MQVGVGLNGIFVVEMVKEETLFQVAEELISETIIAVFGPGSGIPVKLGDDLISYDDLLSHFFRQTCPP